MSSPETPKSHILICPFELPKILDGLISDRLKRSTPVNHTATKTGSDVRTTMDDTVSVVEVSESFEHGMCDLGDNLDINGAYLLINPIEGTLVHKLHTNADVRIRQKRAVERNDISRVTVVHDL